MEFFEVTNTQRAMRRLKTDDVPDDLLWKILRTATMAPSGGNRQPWNFVVVRDPGKRAKIGEWYLDAWEKTYGPARQAMQADGGFAAACTALDHDQTGIRSRDELELTFVDERSDFFQVLVIAGNQVFADA